MSISKRELAQTIDHSLLGPALGIAETRAGLRLALAYEVAAVSVKPFLVRLAANMLRGTGVLVDAIVGFPHGGETSTTKAFEAAEAVGAGAGEIDMVINIGALIDGDHALVGDEIALVVRASAKAPVKVILETAYLTDDQIIDGCHLAEQSGARFVKTSTGFAPTGCNARVLRLMRKSVGPAVQVKAAQGIRTYDDVLEAMEAGASRVGTSATAAIMSGWESAQQAESSAADREPTAATTR